MVILSLTFAHFIVSFLVVRGYSSLSAQYNGLVTAGKLSYDSHQFGVVKELDEIRNQLSNNDYNPPVPPSQSSSLISKARLCVLKAVTCYI